jgi:hypothetical protein
MDGRLIENVFAETAGLPPQASRLLEGLDVFDLEVAFAIAGDEVVLEVDLGNEPLFGTKLSSKRFA